MVIRIIVMAAFCVFSAGAAAVDAPRATSFSWIVGCWGFERAGSEYREHWMPTTGNLVAGISQRTTEGFSKELEHLRITAREVGFDYWRETQEGKQFRYGITESSDHSASFQSFDANVFPAIIRYEYIAPDILNERLEGTSGGKRIFVEFPMHRVACDAPIPTSNPAPP